MKQLLQKQGFICDMDGVIYHGNKILPGVAEFLDWMKQNDKSYLFLTNSGQYTPRELQQKLARMLVISPCFAPAMENASITSFKRTLKSEFAKAYATMACSAELRAAPANQRAL